MLKVMKMKSQEQKWIEMKEKGRRERKTKKCKRRWAEKKRGKKI
jgi:hypothetical protein